MATRLTIDLPSEYWYFNNSGGLGFYFYLDGNTTNKSIGFLGFDTPYTTSDLAEYCSVSNTAFTIDFLTIQFTINNSTIDNVYDSNNNTSSYWSTYISMKITGKVNGSSYTNLDFSITPNVSFSKTNSLLTLVDYNQDNNVNFNTSSVNPFNENILFLEFDITPTIEQT
jgi:hypothetical protein